ncbi:MAG: helix-turn-helix domain-containing protein [Thiomicrorhabdus sp.]|nr:helix-turn-helix domain-containing protein [Thiomicrorhabdus sp.]
MENKTLEESTSLNALLSSTREAQGLSLEQASRRLNLSLEQLEKLEKNGLEPEKLSTFERGYVRNYARLLGLEEALIDHYFVDCHHKYSTLHSVKEYGCSTQKPLLGRSIIKWLFVLALVGLVLLLTVPVFSD